jgi:hypothetical protein
MNATPTKTANVNQNSSQVAFQRAGGSNSQSSSAGVARDYVYSTTQFLSNVYFSIPPDNFEDQKF